VTRALVTHKSRIRFDGSNIRAPPQNVKFWLWGVTLISGTPAWCLADGTGSIETVSVLWEC
jgi:hypothetical protein